MKKVLVIHYSQTGQATKIAKSVMNPLEDHPEVQLSYEQLQPIPAFDFPWTSAKFFDAFPESHREIPCQLAPFNFDQEENFDLIVITYQTWYLTPSIPVNSFLLSPQAKRVMQGKPVITIIGCRNMWTMGQEKMKRKILDNGAKLIGNIAMVDRAPNLVSVLSILRWMTKGRQEASTFLPKSGVAEKDITAASKFGHPILDALQNNSFTTVQQQLNKMGAVNIFPNLLMLEKRADKIFGFWSNYIRQKGGAADPGRKLRLKAFSTYLFIGIFILSPLTTVISWFVGLIFHKKIQKEVAYFEQNELR